MMREDEMDEKFFIIYLSEYQGDGSSRDMSWKIGSKLYDTEEEANRVYEEASNSHSCFLCKTIK